MHSHDTPQIFGLRYSDITSNSCYMALKHVAELLRRHHLALGLPLAVHADKRVCPVQGIALAVVARRVRYDGTGPLLGPFECLPILKEGSYTQIE